MKNVLCAMWMPNEKLIKAIFQFGQDHDWLIELCGRAIPPGWRGDGVLTDYLQEYELRSIPDFPKMPIVCRENHPKITNSRTVVCHTKVLAEMVINYFQNKGFSNFAAVDARPWPGYYENFPQDPIAALEKLLGERHLKLQCCYWCLSQKSDELTDYGVILDKLQSFFRRIPKPIALFVPNVRYLTAVYRGLLNEKIRVPEEVAVICNSDLQLLTEYAMVPTTRICGESEKIGRSMAELLERMMQGEPVPPMPEWVMPAAIIPKRSTDVLAVKDPQLNTAINFLLRNYSQNIGIRDVADAAEVSVATLIQKFQRELTKTPRRFLQDLRFNQIRELLDTTELTLNEIASRSGYGSNMALSLAFRREFGMTPGAYRKRRGM